VVRVESGVQGEHGSSRDAAVRRLTAWVEGRVQGVGFRWWVRANALELRLAGYAENLPDGRVKVIAEGDGTGCQELLRRLEDDDATSGHRRPGKVRRVTHRWAQAEGGISGFRER
jgi:acylphosphatase